MLTREPVKRILYIIGIDGADFSIIKPLIKKGELPNLAKLIAQGAHGNLLSTIPPVTAPAWTSFMTGMNPGKHGLYDFFGFIDENYRRPLVSYKDIQAPTIWKTLTDNKKKVGILNVPITYPPENVHGFVIPGMQYAMSDSSKSFTHPPELLEWLNQLTGGYRVGPEMTQNLDIFLEELKKSAGEKASIAVKLIEKYPCDVYMTLFKDTDVAQHFFWRFFDPSHPAHDVKLKARYGEAIHDVYRIVDDGIGKILGHLPDDAVIMVISDHGTGPQKKDFLVNRWFMDQGYLKIKPASYPLWKFRYPHIIQKFLFRMGVKGVGKPVPKSLSSEQKKLFDPRQNLFHDAFIDRTKTRAFFGNMTEQGIYINSRKRFSEGIVSDEEYEVLRNEILQKLTELRDPENGEKVLEGVFKREDVYTGQYVSEAPDIILIPSKDGYIGHKYFYLKKYLETSVRISGTHRMNGVFILYGRGISNRGSMVRGARIIDVAPTIHYLFGLPVPGEMDGSVLIDAFEKEYLEKNPVKYMEKMEGEIDKDETKAEIYEEGDREKLIEHLKGLGYI